MIKSDVRLIVAYGYNDQNGGLYVVGCGYVDARYGYFIASEFTIENTDRRTYEYRDIIKFYPKENETSYQTALREFYQLMNKLDN